MLNGELIKKRRVHLGYTLKELSEMCNCTASFLSQVERGLKQPSLYTLRTIAKNLDTPIYSFFEEADAHSVSAEENIERFRNGIYGVRHDNRKKSTLVDNETTIPLEYLTPQFNDDGNVRIKGVTYSFEPGEWVGPEGYAVHSYDECTFVYRGSMEIVTPDYSERYEEGDCIYITAFTPHNFRNCGDDICTVLVFNN